MRRTSRLVLLLGVFLAALTFVVVLFLGSPGTPTQPVGPTAPPTQLPTVVAAQDIPLGTVITLEMLTTRTLAVGVREAGVLGDPSQGVGKTTQRAITAGAQVKAGDFQDRGVELSVPPGTRALTIAVNELSGIARLVTTGDSVDIVVTLSGGAFPVTQVLSDGTISAVPGINPLTTKLLMQDIRVIGTLDAQVVPPPAAANQPAPVVEPGFIGEFPAGSKLVILALTPAQAEVIVFARSINTRNVLGDPDSPLSQIDLVLRSPADAGLTGETTGVILKTLVETYGVLPPELVPVPIPTP